VSVILLRVTALLYAASAGFYLWNLVRGARPGARAATAGAWLLLVAFLIHAVAIGWGCKEFGGTEFLTLNGGLVMLAWLSAGAYLVLDRIHHIPSVGAFVTPLILAVLVPTLRGPGAGMETVPAIIRSRWLSVHVSSAFLGIALFAIAFGVALMYLLMEREVKGKRFGALFSRLPSLDQLDRLNQSLVRWGFLIFSVALVTGAFFAREAWGQFWEWDPKQTFSLMTWALYGALVQLRHSAGWHGRRVAVLTMVGFALVLGSFVGFGVMPTGRHGGDWQ
jgi:cytochrome c-type biogenesis protein CcsB